MIKISVIAPIYNVESYLRRFLDSFLNQTLKEFELICVNDGSTDGSAEILDEYAAKDSRICVLHQANQGSSVARNLGLDQAHGAYIVFADSDDMVEPQTLEIAYHFIRKEDAGLVIFDWKKNALLSEAPSPTFFDIESIETRVHLNPVCAQDHTFAVWNKLYKKELFEGVRFAPGVVCAEDFPVVYSIFAKRPKTVFVSAALYLYTCNPQSVMASRKTISIIENHQVSLDCVYSIYSKPAYKKEFHAVTQLLLPRALSYQRGCCYSAGSPEEQEAMLQLYSQQLHRWNDLKLFGIYQNICITNGFYYFMRCVKMYITSRWLMLKYPKKA